MYTGTYILYLGKGGQAWNTRQTDAPDARLNPVCSQICSQFASGSQCACSECNVERVPRWSLLECCSAHRVGCQHIADRCRDGRRTSRISLYQLIHQAV